MTNVIKQTNTIGKKVFYGWRVVAAGSLLMFLGGGSVFYGFNTFFTPMVEEFGWSRAVISGAFSLSRLEGGIEGPLVGWLIDKFGSRKLAFVGVVLAATGFIALILVNSALKLYLIFGLLISMGMNTGFFHTSTAAAAKWFIKKRSRALTFVMLGVGVGGAVMVPLLAWFITQYGWRSAAVAIGLLILVAGLPAAFFLRSSPEEMGLLPDGETIPEAQLAELKGQPKVTDSSLEEIDFTVREALRTRAFWTYAAAMTLRATILSAMVVHQIPHLIDMGISYQAAAGVLGTMVLMSIPGRLIFGWIGDIFNKRYLIFICCLLQAIGIWVFLNATTLGMVYVFVVIFGLGYGGAIPLTLGLKGDLFGRKIFATIGGLTVAITSGATIAAPVLAGYLYDVTQSYQIGFYVLLACASLSGFAFLLVPQPKPPARLTVSDR